MTTPLTKGATGLRPFPLTSSIDTMMRDSLVRSLTITSETDLILLRRFVMFLATYTAQVFTEKQKERQMD